MTDPTTPDAPVPNPTTSQAPTTPEHAAPLRRAPVARWIRRLPQWAYVTLILGAVVALLVIASLVNPGERVGPVQHARPPVGGPTLPATRL